MQTFSDLGLSAALVRALSEERYETPTPIQTKAIPVILGGADLIGIAQTGTGKTAAFALPILERLAANRKPPARKTCRALVLSPTRELATQIAESFRTYGRHMGLRVAVVFGGVGHRPQIDALSRGVDVLVATPGRLIDHIEGRAVSLEGVEIFVLDEADQMLDLGFIKPIQRIAALLSRKRQSLFFSATMPQEIGRLADALLTEPVKVSVAPQATTAERVDQRVIHVPHSNKRAVLVKLLTDAAMSRTLVFTRTKRGADRVSDHLERSGFAVAAIHGNKSQRQRDAALADFKASRIRVLVATDIAARGIDVDLVSHVVNFELPDVPESYVHRIGRTARAGAAGTAISLVDGEERSLLRDIERLTRRPIPAEVWTADGRLAEAPADMADGGRRGPSRAPRSGTAGPSARVDRNGRTRRSHGSNHEPSRPQEANGDRRQRRDGGRPAAAKGTSGHGAKSPSQGGMKWLVDQEPQASGRPERSRGRGGPVRFGRDDRRAGPNR